MLDESGYTEMWQKDRSADAAGRLENLKELVRSMEEFENLQGFLEHISLVMDTDRGGDTDAVSIMTLHSAKGLEFDTVFLPGWEEGLLPHQRSLDEEGRAGLEEERRLAHVGHDAGEEAREDLFRLQPPHARQLVRDACRRASSTNCRSPMSRSRSPRASAALPATAMSAARASTRPKRSDRPTARPAGSAPAAAAAISGRAETSVRVAGGGFREAGASDGAKAAPAGGPAPRNRGPITIEGELVAKSTGTASVFAVGDRVFHQKFGNGNVRHVEGNKLTIDFDHSGEKKVVDSFVARV